MKEIMAGITLGSAVGAAVILASDGDVAVIAYAIAATVVCYIAAAVINEYNMHTYHKRVCESEEEK